jgi:hypothetical protein
VIHVVTGHICSGKSTHVRQHAKTGDIVIDLDRIALALSVEGTDHHDYPEHVIDIARAARWYAMDKAVSLHRRGGFDVWIIHAYPTPTDLGIYRRIGATMTEKVSDEETLMARANAERPRRAIEELRRRLQKPDFSQ